MDPYENVEKADREKEVLVIAGSPPSWQLLVNLFLLLRPQQWIKNVLLFAGLIFSFELFYLPSIASALLGFVTFCFLSGSVYIINDLVDIKEDRKHPQKKHRSLAAEKVKVWQAVSLLVPLLALSLYMAWVINVPFLLVSLLYFALTLFYSLYLKYMVIIDVLSISLGFLLRAVAGAVAINVDISTWFLFCTLLLSLFMALTKRRQELVSLAGGGAEHRKVLEHYSVSYLDSLISIVTASTIVGYSLYTFTATASRLFMLTIPFVIYGIFRYLYLVHQKDLGENAEVILLKDRPMVINILLWLLLSIAILYLEQAGVSLGGEFVEMSL